MKRFAEIEAGFAALLNSARPTLTPQEVGEVQEFIDVGEYGLALETFIDIHREQVKRPTEESKQLVMRLAEEMMFDPDEVASNLRSE